VRTKLGNCSCVHSFVQAELWKAEYDELEDDDNFIHYVEMMNRQVPHAAVAAKLERDGEDEETVSNSKCIDEVLLLWYNSIMKHDVFA